MSYETEDPHKKKRMNSFLVVEKDRCPAHTCVAAEACPEEARTQNGTEPPVIDITKCTLCEVCLHFCEYDALQVHTMQLF